MLNYYRFKTVSDLFMQGKPEEARLELAELQRRYVDICSENTSLKTQRQEYEDILYLSRNLILDGKYYWLITGSIKQGPFCPHCYDQDGLLMRLAGESGERICTFCRTSYTDPVPMRELAMVIAQEFYAQDPIDPADSSIKVRGQSRGKAKIIPFAR